MSDTKVNSVGRPKMKDSEKVIYQRVALEYPIYKKFQEVVKKEKIVDPKITISKIQEKMIDLYTKKG